MSRRRRPSPALAQSPLVDLTARRHRAKITTTSRRSGGCHGAISGNDRQRTLDQSDGRRARHAAALCAAQRSRAQGPALRLRPRAMRLLHRACRRRGGALLHRPGRRGRQPQDRHPRRPRHAREAASRAEGLHRRAGGAVRLLHQRHDHAVGRLPRPDQEPERGPDQAGARRQSLPLRDPCAHPARGEARRGQHLSGEADMLDRLSQTRRDFLKSGGALVVTFATAGRLAPAFAEAALGKTVAPDEVDGFLAIAAQGAVTAYSGKVDLGTGLRTALTQIVAEELDVPMARVSVIQGDTALTPDQGPSYGSLSIQNGGMQLRQAAATARRALLREAAQQLSTKPDDLVVEDGTIKSPSNGKTVSYGELIGGRDFSLKLDKDAPLKEPKRYRVVGTSVPRLDIPDNLTGRFTYAQDFRLPDMLHGRVVRPPAIGATLQSVDEGSVKNIPGVKGVRQGNFLGVAADNEWAAIKAMRQLKASWSNWEGLPEQQKLWEHVRATAVGEDDVTSNVGDAAGALGQGAKRLKATYDFAIHTHGSIGPSCAVAEIKDGKLTCWTPSQATHNLRKQLT